MLSFSQRLFASPRADIFGGLTAAVTALPLAIAFGVMVTNELGPQWSSVGAVAGLYGAIFTGFFAALFGGTPCQVTGPTGPMTTVLAGMVAALVASHGPQLKGEQVLILVFLMVSLAGIFQILLGLARLGGLIKYIPYPVTAGFMNGIAVIIFLGQRKPFVGMEDGIFDPGTALVGALTFAIILLSPQVTAAVPGSLVGLVLGTAIYYAMASAGVKLGPVVGEVPTALPSIKNLWAFLALPGQPYLSQVLPVVIKGALTLAMLGAIDSLLTSVVADTVTRSRHDSNQELIGQGLGNAAAGIFGGFAGAGATIRTLVNINAGGRGKLSGMVHSLVLLIVVVAVGSTAGKIPNVVLSAILMVTAWGMLDRWSGGLIKKLSSASGSRQEIMFNLGLVIAVTAVTVLLDLMIAVAMGLVMASLHFVVRSGDSVVRGVYTAEIVHSRRVYPLDAEKALEGQGKETLIVALQGSLFFGSSDRFSRVLEESISPETRRVILDMHRVTSIDSSGGLALQQLQESLCSSGRQLAICGLPRGTAQWAFLQDLGVVEAVKPDYFFPDLDRALEWSEVLTLESLDSLDGTYLEHDLRTLDLFDDFSDKEFAALLPHLTLLQAEPGEYLFRKGDPADSMVIITQGAVHLFPGTDPAAGTRLSHFGPGATFGQVSMLKGECKAASAVVDQPLKAYRLSRASMEALQNDQPRVLNRLLLALGKDLAQRVSILREELNAVES